MGAVEASRFEIQATTAVDLKDAHVAQCRAGVLRYQASNGGEPIRAVADGEAERSCQFSSELSRPS